MYKTVNNLPGEGLSEYFVRNMHNYNLRSRSDLRVPSINTVFTGSNSINHFGTVIWNSIPAELRWINPFQVFKSEIKAWRPTNCACRLCKKLHRKLRFCQHCFLVDHIYIYIYLYIYIYIYICIYIYIYMYVCMFTS